MLTWRHNDVIIAFYVHAFLLLFFLNRCYYSNCFLFLLLLVGVNRFYDNMTMMFGYKLSSNSQAVMRLLKYMWAIFTPLFSMVNIVSEELLTCFVSLKFTLDNKQLECHDPLIRYHLFYYSGFQLFPSFRDTYITRVTRRVISVEQELQPLPEHLTSRYHLFSV